MNISQKDMLCNDDAQICFYRSVEGIVIGDNNTVIIRFTNGQQNVVPFLALPR